MGLLNGAAKGRRNTGGMERHTTEAEADAGPSQRAASSQVDLGAEAAARQWLCAPVTDLHSRADLSSRTRGGQASPTVGTGPRVPYTGIVVGTAPERLKRPDRSGLRGYASRKRPPAPIRTPPRGVGGRVMMCAGR